MNHKRPVNLNLASLKFPVTAITSILHRISGIGIFILLPFILYILHLSLQSRASFYSLQTMLTCGFVKIILWLFLTSLAYHSLAGIRHMIGDLGFGEDMASARISAYILIVLAAIAAILLGVWIWCPM